jgi:hydroxyethylthiazole kinase-like uncharacterized protein yjeF
MQHAIVVPHPELLPPEQMAEADRLAPGLGMPGPVLMENAGRAVARAVRRHGAPVPTLVLCGPGNNGGDGYVVARLLAQSGWPVTVARLAPPRPGSDAAVAARRWHGPEVAFAPAEAARAGLVIDAVFGAGLARDVDGIVAETLAAARRVVAVDVPSGIDGATGAVRGIAPQAELTVTFFRLKPGHVLLPGREHCGRIELADIGLPPAVLPAIGVNTWLNQPGVWQLRAGSAEDHKYNKGHLTVLGGATMTGAARLAAGVARRGGAGLVTIAAPEGADRYRIGGDPGVIVSDAPLAELLQDSRREAWVCGPGLGIDAARLAVPPLLAAGRRVVVDADALTAFAGRPEALRGAAVLTPHAGEFARLFGAPEPDRLAAARAAAVRCGCVVLLKGPDTIVAAPDGRASINASAPPWLATAGSGDVLAGLIGALLAQGLEPWHAASAGAWLHGRAAARHGPGLIAEDLAPAVGAVIAELAERG